MTIIDFEKMMKKFFIDANTNTARVAKMLGTSRQNFSTKIKNGSLRTIEFFDILDMLGYEIEIKKKNDQ